MKPSLLIAAVLGLLLLPATAGAAVKAPGVATGSATGITVNRATLTGSVDANGAPTWWRFDYGTTPNFGLTTPAESIGSGYGARAVSATIYNLTPGAHYYFRLVASNSGGQSYGGAVAFATSGGAPVTTTLAATSISAGGARLGGTINPNQLVTSWYFVYGPTTAYGSRTPSESLRPGGTATSVSFPVSGLAGATTYHFELIAANAAGTTNGGDLTLTTFGVPGVAAVPTVSALTPTSVTLADGVNPNGEATNWWIDYGTTPSYGSSVPGQSLGAGTAPAPVTLSVSNLTPGTTYHLDLVAQNAIGSNASGDFTVSTPASVTLNPAAVRVVAGNYIELSGTAWGGQPGTAVTILAQSFGESAAAPVATVYTGAGGNWTYPARPLVLTSYEASAEGGTSGSVTVAVKPAVSLHVMSGARLLTHVNGGVSFGGRFVQLQRLSGARWVTLKRVRLNPRSTATFSAALLPRGRSTIRIAMSVNQAGPGFLGGLSRQISYTRGPAPRR